MAPVKPALLRLFDASGELRGCKSRATAPLSKPAQEGVWEWLNFEDHPTNRVLRRNVPSSGPGAPANIEPDFLHLWTEEAYLLAVEEAVRANGVEIKQFLGELTVADSGGNEVPLTHVPLAGLGCDLGEWFDRLLEVVRCAVVFNNERPSNWKAHIGAIDKKNIAAVDHYTRL